MEIAVSETPAPSGPSEENGSTPEAAAEPVAERLRLGPGEDKNDECLEREAMALLFATTEPLSSARLVELLERPAPARVQAALERLQERLEQAGLPLVLAKVAGAWRLSTDPDSAPVIGRLREEPRPERISAAALETLAIIAYRQPVSKAEIEAIRGVQAGPVLRSLVDRGLVRITGRAELPGQPLLYGTTKEFLERFGLGALKDLPRDGELSED
jgi:segregation and condensation protein B